MDDRANFPLDELSIQEELICEYMEDMDGRWDDLSATECCGAFACHYKYECKYCGKDGLEWGRLHGKRRLFERDGNVHTCDAYRRTGRSMQ